METTADQVVRPLYQEAIAKWKGKIPKVLPQILPFKLSQIHTYPVDQTTIAKWKRQVHKGTTIVVFKLSQRHTDTVPEDLLP